MVEFLYTKVKDAILPYMKKTIYVALTCDKVRSITNGSYNLINA